MMKDKKISAFFHLVLFAIYPILSLLSQNYGEALWNQTFPAFVVIFFIALIIVGISFIVYRNVFKATIATTLFLTLFFSHGHLLNFVMNSLSFFGAFPSITRYLLGGVILFLIPFGITCYFLYRTRKNLVVLTYLLNVAGVALVLTSLFTLIPKMVSVADIHKSQVVEEEKPSAKVSAGKKLPDVYYIILDGYAKEDVLKNRYNFSNRSFVEQLEKKGFYVGERSYSNYMFTVQSLASSLNMNYLEALAEEAESSHLTKYSWLVPRIQNNKVLREFAARGYETIQLGAYGFPPTQNNPWVDKSFGTERLNSFSRMLLKSSIISPLMSIFVGYELRISTQETLKQLKNIEDQKSPKFVFVHIMVPHPEYVFKSDGGFYSLKHYLIPSAFMKEKYYAAQVEFINHQMLEVIDSIKARTNNNVVIILQGDHGPRPEWRGSPILLADGSPETRSQSYLREAMGILNAVYIPSGSKSFYPQISPVNNFRLVFNEIFDENYEILEDKFYAVDPEGGFMEVTSSIV